MRPDTRQADAVMRTLGYSEVSMEHRVPGRLTKATVVLLCALAVVAGFWIGTPFDPATPRVDVFDERQPATRPPEPVISEAEESAGVDEDVFEGLGSLAGDIELPAETPRSAAIPAADDPPVVEAMRGEAESREIEPGAVVPEVADDVDVEAMEVRDAPADARFEFDGDPDAAESAARIEPSTAESSADGIGPVVTLSEEELRALVELDIAAVRRRAGQIGTGVDRSRSAGTEPVTPVVVARSSRPPVARLTPPEPPLPVAPAASGQRLRSDQSPQGNGFRLALRHHESGEFEAAQRQYRDLIAANGADAEAQNNLGVLYQEHGRTQDAIRAFEQALGIDPNYVKARNNLGVAFLSAGMLEDAAREFERALARDPENLESKVNLGLVLNATGRPSEAIERLLDVIATDPGHLEAHYNLALVYEAQRETEKALAHYRRFLTLGTDRHPALADGVRRRVEILASGRLEY